MKYIIFSLAIVLFGQHIAHAESVRGTTNTGVTTQIQTRGGEGNETGGDIDDLVQGEMMQVNKDAEDDLRGEAQDMQKTLDEKKTIRGESTQGKEAEYNDQSESEFEDDIKLEHSVRLDTKSLRGLDDTAKGEIKKNAEQLSGIKTEDDLKVLAQAVLLQDDNITDITTDNTTVKMHYRRPAKLFGFIPAHFSVETTVGVDGKVSVRYPWYVKLMRSNSAAFDAAIQSEQDQLDTLGDMTEIQQLKLQQLSDRRAKAIEMLSTLMKKASETADTIVGNIK